MNIPNAAISTQVQSGSELQAPSQSREPSNEVLAPRTELSHDKLNAQQVSKVEKDIEKVNKTLEPTSMKVVLDPKSPPNRLWLNMVDSSGQVIEKFPPEGLRRFLETNGNSGLKIDVRK